MRSKLLDALKLAYEPVALVWSNERPKNVIEFGEGKWGCLMFHLVAAAKGHTAAISCSSFGCVGGGVGMGFGNCYLDFPGGCESFYRFLADGNLNDPVGRQIGEGMVAHGHNKMAEDFLHGERYVKDAEATKRFVEALPICKIPAKYVIMRPLSEGDFQNEELRSITLLVNPDQLSALVVLANYAHPERENVGIPFAAGCQIMGIFMYRERERDYPRALIGLTDLSARKNVRRTLGKDMFSFSMTPEMFIEMENNIENSFLSRPTWQELCQV